MFKKIKNILNRKEKRKEKLEVEELLYRLDLIIEKLDRLPQDNKTINKFINNKFNKGL